MNDDNPPIKITRFSHSKFFKLLKNRDSPSDSSSSETEEYEEIIRDIKSLNDLIELGKLYNPKKKYNINLKNLNNIVKPLEQLNNMIGMDNIKESILGHIIFYLQKFEDNPEMMHTVIQGQPGVGKTMLGKILGEIYYGLGILKGNNKRDRKGNNKYVFKIVKRSDLIAKYLGQTAIKTQKVIDSCKGGVMFIDEAYSLGNSENGDSYSKECIDTINQNLTENKGNFLCIIAGYQESLEKCFFAYNQGLSRRFTFRYTINPYTAKQLRLIFIKMVKDIGWIALNKNIPFSFFKKNYESFKNMAGDMESLLFNCKIEHGKRVFCFPDQKKKLSLKDIANGFKVFSKNRCYKKEKKEEEDDSWKNLYI